MHILKKLLSDSIWYGLSSILGRLINYALVPLFTAALPLTANGVITELYANAAFLNVLLTFGMETAYFRFGRGGHIEEAQQAARGQTLIAAASLSFCLLVVVGRHWLFTYLPYPRLDDMLALLAAILISDALSTIPMARLRLQGKAKLFAAYRLGTIGLYISLNLLFVLCFAKRPEFRGLAAFIGADEQPVLWVLWANLLSNAPLLLLVKLSDFQPKLLKGPEARFMFRYALPIVVMGLAGMTNQMLGTIQLKYLIPNDLYPELSSGTEAIGVYGQCYKLSIFMALVIQAFRLGAEPFFFSLADKKDKEAGFALVMRWFVLACIGVFMAVCLNLGWLAPLVLRRDIYLTGLSVVPTLLMANLWLGVYYNLSVWFKLTDRTHWGTWLSLGGMIATIALNFTLIPKYGYDGAAAATFICYLGMATASYFIGQRFMPVPYAAGRLFLYAIAAFLAINLFERWSEGITGLALWGMRFAFASAYFILIIFEALPLMHKRRLRSQSSSA